MSEELTTKYILPPKLLLSPRQEVVILGASEYLSRIGRCNISRLILTAITEQQSEQGLEDLSPKKTFAALANVSTRTIERWVGGDVQSCNINAEALLRLGLRFDKEGTMLLLKDEQARHEQLIKQLIKELDTSAGV